MAIPQGFNYVPLGGSGGRPFGSMGGGQDVYAQFLNSLNMPPAHSSGPIMAPQGGVATTAAGPGVGGHFGGARNPATSMNWAQLMPYLQKMFSGGIGNVNWAQLLPMLMGRGGLGFGRGWLPPPQEGGLPSGSSGWSWQQRGWPGGPIGA